VAATAYVTLCDRLATELTSGLAATYPAIVVSKQVWDPARLPAFTTYSIVISPSSRLWSERRINIVQIQYTFSVDLYLLVKNFDEVGAVFGTTAGSLGVLQMIDDVKSTLRSSTLSGLLDKTYDEPGGEVSFGKLAAGGLDTAEHYWVHRALIPYTGRMQPFAPTRP
jgi:hypothetical protein